MKIHNSNKYAFFIGLLMTMLLLIAPLVANAQGKIAFESDRDGNPEIYVMNPDGSNQIRLTTDPAFDFDPSLSADGGRIAFQSTRDGNYEIYVMNADGSNQTRLTYFAPDDDTSPSFSPDADKIVFVSKRDGNQEIYVMNADGSNQVRLTYTDGFDAAPTFSPDGSKIAFVSERDGNPEIYIMNADGSNQVRLTNISEFDSTPAFSPDGSKIAFESMRDGNFEIYTMNPDGTNQTRVTDNPAEEINPSWGGEAGGGAPPVLSNVVVVSAVDENSSAVLTGNIGSQNAGDSFTLTVDWGDGSPAEVFNYAAGTSSFSETHQYRDDNPTATPSDNYTVSLTLTTAGGSDTGSAVATVNNVAPALSNLALNPSNVTVGSPAVLNGSVTDAGTLDSHTVQINWGDGSPDTTLNLAAGVANFSASHTYNAGGNLIITVTATDDDGAAVSSTLNTSGVPPAVPATPINLKVDFVGANQVNLKWTDTSNNESGFVIEQCRSKNCNSFVEVGQTGANVTTFLDTGLLANTQYNYRVRAINPGGSSAYSNTATAKTLRK